MPTTQTGPTDLDYDLALLPHEGITNDALDLLDAIADTAEAARKLLARLGHMQQLLEQHANPYTVREQFAVDIEQAADDTHRHVGTLLGAEQTIY